MADTATIRYEIDFQKLRDNAEAAGFNPLTALRNGAASGFAVEHHPINQMGSFGVGSAYAATGGGVEYGGGEFTSVQEPVSDLYDYYTPLPQGYDPAADAGNSLFGMTAHESLPGMYYGPSGLVRDGNQLSGPGNSDSETYSYVETDPAHMRKTATASISKSFAGHFATEAAAGRLGVGPAKAIAAISGAGGIGAAVSSGGKSVSASDKARATANGGVGKQAEQAYIPDEIPNVIEKSTFHWIMPGVSWEELGGTTRIETMETAYGEDAPGTWLLGVPKFLNDLGHNTRRAWDANMPTYSTTIGPWLEEANARRSGPLPPQEPVNWGQSPFQPTPSYAISK